VVEMGGGMNMIGVRAALWQAIRERGRDPKDEFPSSVLYKKRSTKVEYGRRRGVAPVQSRIAEDDGRRNEYDRHQGGPVASNQGERQRS
jgi:hypothetical protein